MAHQDDIQSVCNELDGLFQYHQERFAILDWKSCGSTLKTAFEIIRLTHVNGMLPDEELTHYVREWKGSLLQLSDIAPREALSVADTARASCVSTNGEVYDTLLVNTACVCVNTLVMPAFYDHLKSYKVMHFEEVGKYLNPIKNVLFKTAPFLKSAAIQDTFFEALTLFENMAYGFYMGATTRYDLLMSVKDHAAKDLPAYQRLYDRMEELLGYAEFTTEGRGILRTDLEMQAAELAAESCEWFAKKPVHISAAFAVKAGLDIEFADFHERLETAFAQGKYQDVVKELSDLFARLGEDSEDENEEYIAEDLNSYAYFFENANKLNMMSEDHGYQLAHFCVHAIESDTACVSEKVMAKVYECALPVISFVDLPDSERTKDIKELYKIILKRTSEFEDIDETIDIFGCAEDGYRIHLAKLSPVEIYKEIAELSAWVDEREIASPYLCDFVDSLMDCAKSYGDDMGIPQEYVIGADDDDPDPISPKFSVVDASPAP